MIVAWVRNLLMTIVVTTTTSVLSFSQLPELKYQQQLLRNEIDDVTSLVEVGSPSSNGFLLSLARNYYRLDNYAMAEEFYLQVIDQKICGTLDYKALAISLRQNGKYSLANEFYQLYVEETGDHSIDHLWHPRSAAQSAYERSHTTKLTNFHMLYGHMNEDGSSCLNIDNGTVSARLGCNALTNMAAIDLPVEEFGAVGSYTSGPVPNSYFYSYREPDGHYSIYYLYTKGNGKSRSFKLNLGEPGVDYAYPMFVKNTLYFASNKSGGNGGYDLYRAFWDGKEVEKTENLGPHINTDKNEILPSVFNGTFSFCSNGFPGEGGYDLFSVEWDFAQVDHITWPYNSEANEFLLIDQQGETAAVVREVAKKINLYRIDKYYDYNKEIEGIARDETGNPLTNADILISLIGRKTGQYATTDLDGVFNVVLNDTIKKYQVRGLKPNYIPSSFELDLTTLGDNPLVVVMKREAPVEPEPVYIVSSPSKNVIPSNPEVRDDVQDSDSTSKHDDIYNELQDAGSYYIIYASSKNYNSAYKFWSEWKETFPTAEILKNEEAGVFRVGTFAGTTQSEAMKAYKKAKLIKADAWILRPDQL